MSDQKLSIDLSFLGRDLRNQLVYSQNILSQVRILRETLDKVPNAEAKLEIEKAITSLLGVVDNITANVTSTAASTNTTVSTIIHSSDK